MKWSEMWIPTLKETPKEAVTKSHILMLRAGYISKHASGIYGYLPLGFKVFQKVYKIVQEEIARIGAQQVALPLVVPRNLWEQTGRYQKMSKTIFAFQDRNDQEFMLGPTHEESMVEMLTSKISSYKQFPMNFFQIEKKFRDEIRPRYGVMRGKEFTMMDGYSFHLSPEDMDKVYQKYRMAYRRIFIRMGLDTVIVRADSGDMGGVGSEEFMVPSQIGDDTIFTCNHCDYSANQELATYFPEKEDFSPIPVGAIETPQVKTIAALGEFFDIPLSQTVKTVVFRNYKDQWIIAMIPGDREINELKLSYLVGGEIRYEENVDEIERAIGPVGFLGPKDFVPRLDIITVVDRTLFDGQPRVVGMNKKDFHYQGFVFSNFVFSLSGDITNVKDGDICPICKSGELRSFSGIEVGHIFQLGDAYTRALEFSVLDEHSKSCFPLMGCYGIGIDRSIAAAAEQRGSDMGMVLPSSISPFDVVIVSIGKDYPSEIEELRRQLKKHWEVLWDDRDVSAGIKFKDSELLGIPIRITIGKKFREEGLFGVLHQGFSEQERFVTLAEVVLLVRELLTKEEEGRQKLLDNLDKTL